jgi:hypothetical protein
MADGGRSDPFSMAPVSVTAVTRAGQKVTGHFEEWRLLVAVFLCESFFSLFSLLRNSVIAANGA